MNLDQHNFTLTHFTPVGPIASEAYYNLCRSYLRYRHNEDLKPNFAHKQLCEGPIKFEFAPFYLAWLMKLLPVHELVRGENAPVFYDARPDDFELTPPSTADFIEIMVDLLEGKTLRPAMTMIIEFHDFLAVRAPEQALRFVTDIVQYYTVKFMNPAPLLILKGTKEQLDRSSGFADTLHQAFLVTGQIESSLAVLNSPQISFAYRRLRWDVLANMATENDRVAVLADDLGI
jgi:hypothetical protein